MLRAGAVDPWHAVNVTQQFPFDKQTEEIHERENFYCWTSLPAIKTVLRVLKTQLRFSKNATYIPKSSLSIDKIVTTDTFIGVMVRKLLYQH